MIFQSTEGQQALQEMIPGKTEQPAGLTMAWLVPQASPPSWQKNLVILVPGSQGLG